jgi:GNAT superfamily N-acetyltransferase
MKSQSYTIRKATPADSARIEALITVTARGVSPDDYTPEQMEAALKGTFGVDTDLINDGTFFVAEAGGHLVGCGGWSRRKKLFGGDTLPGQDHGMLDPSREPARIRAFFVHPAWARKGIGRAILDLCEAEALEQGFTSIELMATLPGIRFYSALGYEGSDRFEYHVTPNLTMQLLPMRKLLKP